MEMEISIKISVLTQIPRKKLNSPPRSTILKYFQNQEYHFSIPIFRTQLAEKQEEEEEEHKELQNVLSFKQEKVYNENMVCLHGMITLVIW